MQDSAGIGHFGREAAMAEQLGESGSSGGVEPVPRPDAQHTGGIVRRVGNLGELGQILDDVGDMAGHGHHATGLQDAALAILIGEHQGRQDHSVLNTSSSERSSSRSSTSSSASCGSPARTLW